MGMFDTVKSSYNLGPDFQDKELQTKDLGALMGTYWIDPIGRLFHIDYSGTFDFKWTTTKWVTIKNSNHGRVSPVIFTGVIEVYPSVWEHRNIPFPIKSIKFIDGVIQ